MVAARTPAAPPAAGAPLRARGDRIGVALLVGAAAAVLTVLRLVVAGPGLDRVWAEDGFVFLWDARRYGLESFGYTYAGYAHTVPRAFGLIGAQIPLEHFAVYAVLATALAAGALAAVVFVAARRVTGSWAWALLPALSLALAPAFRGSAGSLANLQWLLLVAAFWLVIDTSGRRWLPAAVTVLAGLTTPLTVFLLPVAWVAHRAGVLRSPAVRGLLAGLAVQVALIAFGGASADNPASRTPQLPGNLFDIALTAAAGPNVAAFELGRFGVLDVSMLMGAVFAGALLLAVYEARTHRTLAIGAVLTGALLYSAISIMSGQPTTRYAAVTGMFLISALALAGPSIPTVLGRVALAALAVNVVLAFPASDFRMSGPSWTDEVTDYRDSCEATGRGAPIALSPEGWGEIDPSCS
ncbi:hypothetical protein DQ239_03320 [Blastococcus sp. TF02-09]|nr:hypothetical protein DQ239_03320 [Blastococcus sp. TF02-9]